MQKPRGIHLAASVTRWTARVWSVASLALILAFIVGEGVNPSSWAEGLGLLLFPLGISVGMVLAWWNEKLGGAITVTSLAAFYLLHLLTAGVFPEGWGWLVVAAPGFLFLIAWSFSYASRMAVRRAHV
jgi:hypothetical protein